MPELAERHGRGNLLHALGPGLLLAATGVGAGDLATASIVGSLLGVTVLWAIVVGALLKFIVTEGLARWQLATGDSFLEGAVRHLGPVVVWAFLPYLLKRPEGYIANVASMGGFLPVPGQTIYGASKAAVKLYTEGLHSELRGTGVGVSIIFPGATATNIAANSGVMVEGQQDNAEMKYKTTPADVAAKAIVEGIEAGKYRVLIGSDTKTMDFLYRLMPERAAGVIYNQMKDLLPK